MPGFMQAKQVVYKSEREVRRALIQVSLYICFLVATTIIALSTQHVFIFYFNQAVERAFPAHPAVSSMSDKIDLKFKDIVTIDEWWRFLQINFIKELENGIIKANSNETTKLVIKEDDKGVKKQDVDDDDDDDLDKKKKKRHKRDKNENFSEKKHTALPDIVQTLITPDNCLLGLPKLRQIRVKKDSCPVHDKFKKYFDACYASYDFAAEDRQPYHKNTQYYSRLKYKATPIFGNLLKYDGPGYMVFLSYNISENMQIIDELIENDWLDVATRMVVLEMVIYNANTHLFNNVKIMAEVLPTGGLIPHWSLDVVPLYTIWSPRNLKTLVSSIVFYLLVVYYTSVEIQELLKEGFSEYFGNAQNYIDIIILLTAYIALTLTMMLPFTLDDFISSVTKDPQTLASLDETCFWYSSYIYVMAVCVFMVWAKVFRFVGFNKTLLQFSTTLQRCFNDILGFAAMFFVVFIAFAIFGNIVFGSSNPDFSTFQSSLFSMVRMVLGDFPYERIEKANRVLGPIFCLTYVILITFILLNMFLAIINETYSTVKLEITEDHSALKTFILNVIERTKNCLRRYMRSTDDSNLKEQTPTSSLYKQNPQDDTRSMFEYGDVPLSSVGLKEKNKAKSHVRPKLYEDDKEEDEDDVTQDLKRINERIDVMEQTIDRMRANMNRLFGRLNRKI